MSDKSETTTIPKDLERALTAWVDAQTYANAATLYNAAVRHFGLVQTFDDQEVEL